MRALLASPLGLLIGISLGALGGGGSILAIPALVYGAGQTPTAASTTSLILVALTSLLGIVPHWRAGRVRAARGLAFGAAGVGGALLGSHWNEGADPDVLLLAFSGIMLLAAFAMWRRANAPVAELGEAEKAASSVAVTVAKVLVAGSLVGLLTGFFGVGGGFVIVPALVLALGFTMPEAVGTSLLVITINSVVALSSRLDGGSIEWGTVVPFTIASLIGVAIGSRLASSRDSRSLQRWFVVLLVVVAGYTAVDSVLQLV